MTAVLGALLAACKSVASAVLLFSSAAALGWKGVLDQKFLSQLSRLVKLLFLPCLIFSSVASGMSVPFIAENWLLVVMGIVVVLLGFIIGHYVAVLARVPLELRPWFVLGVAFPNMIALPLVLVEALCFEQESKPGDIAECIDGATTRLFTVCLTHTWLLWVLGYLYANAYISTASPPPAQTVVMDDDALKTVSPSNGVAKETGDNKDKQQLACTNSGSAWICTICMSCVIPRCMLGRSYAEPDAKDFQSYAQNTEKDANANASDCAVVVPVADLADDATDANHIRQASPQETTDEKTGCKTCSTVKLLFRMTTLDNPPVIANILALIVGLAPVLKDLFYGQSAPFSFVASGISVLGKASPAITNLIAGATFGLQLQNLQHDDRLGLRSLGLSPLAMILQVLTRLVLVPTLFFILLIVLSDFLPDDPWSRLILYFQPAGVTANMITVLATLLEQPKGAKLVALSAIPQMLLYIPVSTAFITIGLAMNQDSS